MYMPPFEDVAGDVARTVRCEEGDGVGNVGIAADSPEGDVSQNRRILPFSSTLRSLDFR